MAQVHNALDASLLGPAIRAAVGVRDGVSTVERFGETLQPTIDLYGRPEWSRPRGEDLWSMAIQVAAAAGLASMAYVVNPSTSGMLVCVQHWDLFTNTAQQGFYSIASEAQVTALGLPFLPGYHRDLRGTNSIAQKQTVSQLRYGTNVGAAGTNIGYQLISTSAGGFDGRRDWSVILPPGTAFGFTAQVVNSVLAGTVWGWERKALRGELV